MGLFDDVIDFAKKTFIPKDISIEGLASTPAAQKAMELSMIIQPGIPLGLAAAPKIAKATGLDQVPDMRIKIPFSDKYTTPEVEARHFMQALDATGPGSGIDDALMAGVKGGMPVVQKLMRMMEASPEAMAVVAPLISKLGIVKPRGAAYIPGVHHFESKLAEALDKKFIAPGNPEDLISLKEIRAELGKLPGLGLKKEELSHFNLGPQIDAMLAEGKSKITRQDLASLIDKQMPRIEVATDTERHRGYTLPNYRSGSEHLDYPITYPIDYESYIFHAPPAMVSPDELSKLNVSDFANSISKTRDEMLARVKDDLLSGKINQKVYEESTQSLNKMFDDMAASYGGRFEPFKDIEGSTKKSHYDQDVYPNILGWARTTRRPFGVAPPPVVGEEMIPYQETAKYIEELQSDWASSVRKGNDKESSFPFSNINDLVMRYIDRISRQAGEEAVGWTPPSVQIERWNGSRQLKDYEISDPYMLKLDQFIRSQGSKKLEDIHGKKLPESAYSSLTDFLSKSPAYQRYTSFINSKEGQLARKIEESSRKLRDIKYQLEQDFIARNTPGGIDYYDMSSDARWNLNKQARDFSKSDPAVIKAKEDIERLSSRYPGRNLESELYIIESAAKKEASDYVKNNPFRYKDFEDSNYSGFISNYGEKMPSTAKRILERRGGGKVFNERIEGNPEGAMAEEYAERYPVSQGYVQPPDIGSFFYRIPKEQRGKSVPYPDSLWGLLGAAGLAGMMQAGKKDRQTQ